MLSILYACTCAYAADGTCSHINTNNAMRRIMLITAEGSHLRRSVKTRLKTLVKRGAGDFTRIGGVRKGDADTSIKRGSRDTSGYLYDLQQTCRVRYDKKTQAQTLPYNKVIIAPNGNTGAWCIMRAIFQITPGGIWLFRWMMSVYRNEYHKFHASPRYSRGIVSRGERLFRLTRASYLSAV